MRTYMQPPKLNSLATKHLIVNLEGGDKVSEGGRKREERKVELKTYKNKHVGVVHGHW